MPAGNITYINKLRAKWIGTETKRSRYSGHVVRIREKQKAYGRLEGKSLKKCTLRRSEIMSGLLSP
jgi:hypothetical protein